MKAKAKPRRDVRISLYPLAVEAVARLLVTPVKGKGRRKQGPK